MSTCPACHWENDADSGSCAGCGADLGTTSVQATPVPAPRVDPVDVVPPVAQPAPPAADAPPPDPWSAVPPMPPIVRATSAPVPIRPQATALPRTIEPVRGGPRPVDLDRTPRPSEAFRSVPAPVRDIPVVVAPSPARPAVRRRDEGEALRDGGALPVPERVLGGPGARMCPTCGSWVAAGHSFCRCGAQLPGTAVAGGDPADVLAEGWSRSVFRRAQRAANGGRRVRYDAGLAARVYVVRVAAVLLLLLLLGSQAPPWGAHVRSWVETRVEQTLPGQ